MKVDAGLSHDHRMRERPLPIPPLRIPFENVPRRFGGYERAAIERIMEELSGSYEALWLECATLRENEAALKAELARLHEEDEPQDALTGAPEPSDAIEEARGKRSWP